MIKVTNEKAYKFNGFEEWLVAYKKDLPEILKKDVLFNFMKIIIQLEMK